MSKAFTLIELLVVVSIIVLITALTLPNYRSGDKQLALQRSAYKMAQSLRMAQEYAISAKEFNGIVPLGYGVYFDLAKSTTYILFADLNSDRAYSGTNEKVEEINLETDIILATLNPIASGSSLTIVFIPPDPTIVFYPDASSVVITLKINGLVTPVQKSVRVNRAGLIAVAEGLSDQCNSDADCSDGNLCTNDWCERPADLNSVCHNDSRPNGTDCGDCRECQSGSCTYLCQGAESSCECINDYCRDCSNYYGTNCDYGTCTLNQKPSWSCLSGSCSYSCNNDPTCGACTGGTYSPSPSWIKIVDTTVRDISNLSNTATINKDIYCDNSNCILWTDGAAASTTICIATDSNVYGNILWSKTDESIAYQYGGRGSSLLGDQIGGTHPPGLLIGYGAQAVGGKNWLNRDYTFGTFPAMAACKTKGAGWRLPTTLELDSVRDQGTSAPPKTRLPGMTTSRYWTASEVDANSAYSMTFYFGYGDSNYKDTVYLVRCVRR